MPPGSLKSMKLPEGTESIVSFYLLRPYFAAIDVHSYAHRILQIWDRQHKKKLLIVHFKILFFI